MKAALRLACLTLLPLALAACGKAEKSEKAGAGGEILPGSASDAMLPLDTVKSQPPLAPPPTESVHRGKAGGDAEATASDAAEPGDAASDAAAPPAVTPPPPAAEAPAE